MSAVVVSAFNEFRDAYQQKFHSQRSTSDIQQQMSLTLERRLNGHLSNSNFNIPVTRNATAAALSLLTNGQGIKSATKHPPLTSSNSLALCNPTALCSSLNSKNMPSKEHRKLDRSMSEPVERLHQQQQPRPAQSNSSRYKTELCRPYEENGTCKYGDKCQFAHGVNELRTLARHPKYKTELCRTFHSTGFCPYGPRCHFIHNGGDPKKCLVGTMQSGHVPVTGSLPQAMPAKKELDIGSFSLGSAGEMSSSSSDSSGGSPTSIGGFFLEEALAAFSPVPQIPQTAPPTVSNFFFGQDYVPMKPLSPTIPNVQQSLLQQQAFVPDHNLAPSLELLSSEMDKLNVVDTPVPVTLPCSTTVDINRNIIRLPIFSRLSHGDSD